MTHRRFIQEEIARIKKHEGLILIPLDGASSSEFLNAQAVAVIDVDVEPHGLEDAKSVVFHNCILLDNVAMEEGFGGMHRAKLEE